MSRVIYANTKSTAAQEDLRVSNEVRLVTDAEEGTGVNGLPAGVYGFTYSPALVSAPLFAARRYRSYEMHKLPDGDVLLIGFVSAGDVEKLVSASGEIDVCVQPEPEDGAETLVAIPYSRILHHKQYAVRTEHGITLSIGPG